MSDFYSSEYSYISPTLICMKWQTADHFVWLQSLHLNYLLCLFKLWTCHIHLDPPPHLSVCIFFHCNFPLFSSVGIHRLFLEFIKKGVCCLGRKLHLHAWEKPKGFCGVWQGSWLFFPPLFWEGWMRKGGDKKFLESRKVRIVEVISSVPIFFFPYYTHPIFLFFFPAFINH